VSAAASAPATTPGIAQHAGLRPALQAARARLGLIALLFALAAVAWWSTADRMRGMDDGPGSDIGALGWFLGVWLVMMAAMMLPSVAPTVALYAHMTRRRHPAAPALFTAGYLATWTAAGLLAYGLFDAGRALLRDELAWDRAGQWLAGATLIAAAAYELTPLKDICLAKCRSPLGFLLGAWRDGPRGALRMGVRHGAWCLGCCWALMASLFALGVMSLAWMAFVAALIALEKTLPWKRTVTYGTAGILVALGIALLVAPDQVPGLTIPGGDGSMMQHMGPAGAMPMR
jgi:predicted metal-binding membrane protein